MSSTQMDFDNILPDESEVTKQQVASDVSDFDIEIIDDRPVDDQRAPRADDPNDTFDIDEEIEGVDDSVKKRINRLKYEYHEERREKESAVRERNEAVQFASKMRGENSHLSDLVSRSEQALLSSVSTRADAEIDAATQAYKKAHEENDADALIAAQKSLSQAQADKSYLQNYQPQVQQNQNQPVNPQTNGEIQQQQPQQPQFDAPTQAWLQKNPWWNQIGYEPATQYTLGLHQQLAQRGVNSSNEAYFNSIEEGLANKFPEIFSGDKVVSTVSMPKRNTTVVAPAQRAGQKPRKVRLTETQVRLAKRLGITPEVYAKQMIKELAQ